MRRAAAALLARATELRGVAVAVVSGRDADDLAARTNASGAYLVAAHGLEIRAPGGVLIRDSPPLQIALHPELLEEIEASGLRLEEKKHGVALHWRGIPYEAILPVVEMFRQWAEAADLDLIDGRCVLEARCRGGGKQDALRWLTRAVGASRVLYAGDDLTDFGALRYASQNGRAVFLASDERRAPAGVTVVDSFRQLFRLVREEVMV
jgi:trehalose 6-phosphate phosphatase